MKKTNNLSLGHRCYNFISRVSKGSVLQAVITSGSVSEDLENLGMNKPEATKALIDQALKSQRLSNTRVDLESEEFRKEINRRVLVKNLKQEASFIVGSVPMFKTLQEISVKTALNPTAQLPLSLQLYFGISMPAFIALHIAEHTLPPSAPRTALKYTKIMVGIPFCVMSECVDKVSSAGLKAFNLPDTNLDMQGTIGVPSDLKIQDVLRDMQRWNEENSEYLEGLQEVLNKPRNKELTSNK